ncbi:lipoate--protein ligase family protein [Candidatus Micrarchaeota archaeon]|nr:lipoate--protein ligase family protein [Candidatus Micrarchaeota archaeon]MBI5176822.1 lipoate--protein ligase family protein [Candidatus Micrarchaeota archaeon]
MSQWRILGLQEFPGAFNMALDEAVADSVRSEESLPTIRFYTWNPSCVSIGYFQSLEEEVNLRECASQGVDFVRRITGGGAVFHDRSGEITYSLIAPEPMFSKDIIASYREICGCIINGLGRIGLQAEFKPINDITVGGKKISGNAQTRRRGIIHQHGTILYDLDVRAMFSLLKVSKEKVSDKMVSAVHERVTSVRHAFRALGRDAPSRDGCYNALLEGFTEGKDWDFGRFGGRELSTAKELEKSKYATREWNFMR